MQQPFPGLRARSPGTGRGSGRRVMEDSCFAHIRLGHFCSVSSPLSHSSHLGFLALTPSSGTAAARLSRTRSTAPPPALCPRPWTLPVPPSSSSASPKSAIKIGAQRFLRKAGDERPLSPVPMGHLAVETPHDRAAASGDVRGGGGGSLARSGHTHKGQGLPSQQSGERLGTVPPSSFRQLGR